jgi:hypothetical protein
MSPPYVGLLTFTVIVSGVLAGLACGERLPPQHTSIETKSVVQVSMAVVGTVSALVLGLLVSNANSSFTARANEVTALSADIVRLDHFLRRYGPEAEPAREALRRYAALKTDDLFPVASGSAIRVDNPATNELLDQVEDLLLALHPSDPHQQWILTQSLQFAADIGAARWLLAQQSGQGTPTPFLILVVFWLTLLFASFALFAPHNLTARLTLVLCAFAVSGAVEMILELEQPFAGIVEISPVPMHAAVGALKQ